MPCIPLNNVGKFKPLRYSYKANMIGPLHCIMKLFTETVSKKVPYAVFLHKPAIYGRSDPILGLNRSGLSTG